LALSRRAAGQRHRRHRHPALPAAASCGTGEARDRQQHADLFSTENRADFPVCRDIAAALQGRAVADGLETLCRTDLAGSFLRIEYCRDTDEFWLEPHTDIGAKLFTMLIYLSTEGSVEDWGTDLMNPAGDVLATVPYRANSGVIFIPGSDTWHGFRKRPIDGIRRSLIVNYVKSEWRSRHELAFPDEPVG